MLVIGSRYFLAGAVAVLGLSVVAQATPTIQLLNNIGTWRAQTTVGTTTSYYSQDVANPYGAPPLLPITTPIANGGAMLTFSPTSDFYVKADNAVGSETQTFNGSLSFLVTFPSDVHLTVNLSEKGGYLAGNGVTNVTGTVVVSDFNGAESHTGSFLDNLTGSGSTWSVFDQVTGFNGAYTTYLVSIDNILKAQVGANQTYSNAWVDKKEFILTLTTDGSGGGVPEPASLGILAVGSLAFIARRRRA